MTSTAERDRLIGLAERGHITGESRSTIYERISRGEITVVKRGRRTLLSEAEAYGDVQDRLAVARQAPWSAVTGGLVS